MLCAVALAVLAVQARAAGAAGAARGPARLDDDVRWLRDHRLMFLHQTLILQNHQLLYHNASTYNERHKHLQRSDNPLESYTTKHRLKRESHSLISPFDMSFKKKKYKSKQDIVSPPSASPLQSGRLFGHMPTKAASMASTELTRADFMELISMATESTSTPITKLPATVELVVNETAQSATSTQATSVSTKKPRSPKSKAKTSRKLKNAMPIPVSPTVLSGTKREARLAVKKKSENETVWPVKHAAVVEGDIVLGGLMMVSFFIPKAWQSSSEDCQ